MATAGSYTETCVEAADVRIQLRQGGSAAGHKGVLA